MPESVGGGARFRHTSDIRHKEHIFSDKYLRNIMPRIRSESGVENRNEKSSESPRKIGLFLGGARGVWKDS